MLPLRRAIQFVSSFVALGLCQFVAPPTDLISTTGYLDLPVRYKEVPFGTCELTPGVKSYSGYVDLSYDQHVFFWFFEARNQDPTTAPLTVWINGGPGSSSMIGLFQELGPCGIDENMEVYYNPYAWNNVSNMVFIDQPVATGFSYTVPVPGYIGDDGITPLNSSMSSCPSSAKHCGTYPKPIAAAETNSTIHSANNFWKVMQGFMGAFPQYSRNGFHFTTESYGGHYGPVYNEYFEERNAAIQAGKLPGAHEIALESVLVGNGWYDPLIQYAAYYNYTVYPGNTYDYSPYTKKQQEMVYDAMYGPGNCYDQTVECYRTKSNKACADADNYCYEYVEYPLDAIAGRDEYDIRELTPDPFPYSFYEDYLNLESVQQAIGAYVNFSGSNGGTLGAAFASTGDDDRTQGAPADVAKLVEQGIYFVIYNGDADYNCNWLGNQVVADNIGAPGYSDAGFQNIRSTDGIVHGVVKQSDNFAFARIYEAGHEVPFYQPLVSLEMFDRVINGFDIATGKARTSQGGGYITSGPAESTYREGISTVQMKILPANSTYNTMTNEPNPPKRLAKEKRWKKQSHRRSLGRKRT